MHTQLCVVIPLYKPFAGLTPDEKTSWRQCLKVLATRMICLACPVALDVSGYLAEFERAGTAFQVERFPAAAFAGIDGYNKLMLSREFYRRFAAYEYILTYQLDAFIFHDDLNYWCGLGYSYVGAPWFEGFVPVSAEASLWKVGNGGFTLRNVADTLRVLGSFAVLVPWRHLIDEYWQGRLRRGADYVSLVKSLLLGNNTHWLLNDYAGYRYQHQEDYFWGVLCGEKFSWFKVPSAQEALSFSFEFNPRRMYELNGFKLPTGCHAWEKYDPAFWRQFIAE